MTAITLPILSFKSVLAWEKWLAENHKTTHGLWIQIDKKSSGKNSLTYADALEVALCYGWIDGQKKTHDPTSWLQKFTQRRARSNWSRKNTQHAERLIKSKRMKSAGLKEIKAAKKDGRWKTAYQAFGDATIPNDFLRELKKDPDAYAFFKTLNKTNLYSISYRLQTAKKPETRSRRMKAILTLMKSGKKFH